MRRLGPIAAGALVAGGLAATSLPARASASAHLVYLRGPGAEACAGEPALRAAVSSRLGYDPFFAWARETLFAEIQHDSGAFRAVVKLVDENNLQRGSREISVQGDDCSVVVDALGLTISLTIDPSSVAGRPSEPSAPREPEEARGEPAIAPPASLAPARESIPTPPPRTSEWSLNAGVGLMGAVNPAPSPTAGATVFVGLAWRALSADVEGRADYPATGAGNLSAGRVRSWLFAGLLVPCVHLGLAFGCLVVGEGALGATAPGVLRPRDQYGLWSAVGARLGIEWAPSDRPVTLRASADLLGSLVPETLKVDQQAVHQVAPWSAALALAAAWRFR